MKTARKIAAGVAIGVTFTVLTLWLDSSDRLAGWEAITWNQRVRQLAPRADVPIKVILLDQSSLQWGKDESGLEWPWPKSVYSYFLSYLRRAEAKAIGFDVLFTLRGWDDPTDDQDFADAIAQTPNFVCAMVPSDTIGSVSQWPPRQPKQFPVVGGFDSWQQAHPRAHLSAQQAVLPINEILAVNPRMGHVHGEYDPGNQIHAIHPIQIFDNQSFLLLGIATATVAEATDQNKRTTLPALQLEVDSLHIGDRVIPMDERGKAFLNFYRPKDGTNYAFDVYTAADILASESAIQSGEKPIVDPSEFKDCIVFFGFSAPSLYDLKATPFNDEVPGVEMHATAAANYLTNSFITQAHVVPVFLWTFFLAAFAATGAVLAKRAKHLVILSIILVPLPFIAGVMGYKALVWWPIVAPALAMAFALVSGIVLNYATEGKQRRFIRRAFEHYLNPGVVDQLVDDPEKLQLGGEQRELSIFFADLSGFTNMSAAMSPHDVTSLLNRVLTEMTAIIFEECGTLDKYIGDAIVAFWNAPTDQPDHAIRAVRTAMRCQERLAEKKAEFEAMAQGHSISMRIGVHTGPVIVGNMGSQQQFNYSIIGDAANLASRLEGANKAFGTPIMVSQDTWTQTNEQFEGRRLANLQVVGRPDPMPTYQPLGEKGDAAAMTAAITNYNKAMTLIDDQQWAAAIQVLKDNASDSASRAYAEYLEALGDDLDQWDGIWRMTKK